MTDSCLRSQRFQNWRLELHEGGLHIGVVGVVLRRGVRNAGAVILANQRIRVVARELGVVSHLVARGHGDGPGRQVEQFASDGDFEDLQLVHVRADVVGVGVDPVDDLLAVVGHAGTVEGRARVGRAEGVEVLIALGAALAGECKLHARQVEHLGVAVTT